MTDLRSPSIGTSRTSSRPVGAYMTEGRFAALLMRPGNHAFATKTMVH